MKKGDIISVGGVSRRLDSVKVHLDCMDDFCKKGQWEAFKRDIKAKIKRWLS